MKSYHCDSHSAVLRSFFSAYPRISNNFQGKRINAKSIGQIVQILHEFTRRILFHRSSDNSIKTYRWNEKSTMLAYRAPSPPRLIHGIFIGMPKVRNRNVHESIVAAVTADRGAFPLNKKRMLSRERASARGEEQLGRNSVHAVELSSRGKKGRLLSLERASRNAWPGISACFHFF